MDRMDVCNDNLYFASPFLSHDLCKKLDTKVWVHSNAMQYTGIALGVGKVM
jgi:hypothetical protein